MDTAFYERIWHAGEENFEQLAKEVFAYQYLHNAVYKNFCNILGKTPENIARLTDIPFLPISTFKTHSVQSGSFLPQITFESSGTTGSINSRHLVKDLSLYEKSFSEGFTRFYGNPQEYCIIGLLPSYLERGNSSLVYMVNYLIRQSAHPNSGFYLNEFEKLEQTLRENENSGTKTLLIGVTFALLDFAEQQQQPLQLKNTIVMETGGMKGRREELTRATVHEILKEKWQLAYIHSEYGMTELMSQGYSSGEGLFKTPGWLKILIRDDDDPFSIRSCPPPNELSIKGAINIIDLANVNSCAFIATDDYGKLFTDGSFEVMGRLDNSDIRGCSQMVI